MKTLLQELAFQQVDVFSPQRLGGNPLAVVVDGDGLDTATMAKFANWTNLSETTFLLKPMAPDADYRVRIFTPHQELPFAGHPTLGSCHAWLASGGRSKQEFVIQECEAGLIRIRRDGDILSFLAPDLVKAGDIDSDLLKRVVEGLGLSPDRVVDANWVDNGPGWMALLLKSRDDVLEVRPNYQSISGLRVGLIAPCPDIAGVDFEVRAFTAAGFEDPVTGSLNAGLARWLISAKLAPPSYIAAQGTVLGRSGRIHVQLNAQGVWVGGNVVTCIEGKAII
ncbi:PhzF family phenazine biosynthesis protein [Pseudorhizobium pelagicum]|uniref:Phenazine biosynthesis protein PhzF n=1 Tax=Pseudorhizobium pelagicum TaxID=1509405 RepID=A0A922NX14_9HYPH|nr:PhzF family phenazine biosynthesis protein [Pseudorhizobium pelagicum]KEQ02218.1 phenazine biosynthesis protein PhzF [Pseudorhizobium pelagicum]KEQ02229.1 phenazine biosynthesis protein PhzF [Pseudorhizobium pelagicum]